MAFFSTLWRYPAARRVVARGFIAPARSPLCRLRWLGPMPRGLRFLFRLITRPRCLPGPARRCCQLCPARCLMRLALIGACHSFMGAGSSSGLTANLRHSETALITLFEMPTQTAASRPFLKCSCIRSTATGASCAEMAAIRARCSCNDSVTRPDFNSELWRLSFMTLRRSATI